MARNYYFSELTHLTAWDGTPIKGMYDERKFRHLICKHDHDKGDLNPLKDIDVRRVECLPVLRAAVEGKLPADIYEQCSKSKVDRVEVVVGGPNVDYVVVLGCVKGAYILRSAYPGGEQYVETLKTRGRFVGSIGPNT